MFSEIKKWGIKLLICIFAGTGLMLLVYGFPTEAMKQNVARSSQIFNYEGIYPQLVDGYKYMQLDNYTDSIMLGAAIYNGDEEIIDKAMRNYHIDCDDLTPERALTNYSNNADFDYFKVPYERYWHGYVVPLKILLLFFDYADIRVLNYIFQGILLLTIISLFYKAKLEKFLIAFFTAILVINPMTTAVSLQYSAVYIISLSAIIYLLYLYTNQKMQIRKVSNLFFLVGVATSFFDFLTFPFVSFGLLAILYLNMNAEKLSKGAAPGKELIRYLVLWTTGYGGMWIGKWMIGSILLKENLFAKAINQVMLRLSSESTGLESYSRLGSLWANIEVFAKWPFVLLVLAGILLFIVKSKKICFKNIKANRKAVTVYSIATLLPLVWLMILSNHSREHYWFTYKELSVSCFAVISLVTFLIVDTSLYTKDSTGYDLDGLNGSKYVTMNHLIFDIKSVCSDYASLTADNFYFCITKYSVSHYIEDKYNIPDPNEFIMEKSYDNVNGQLKIMNYSGKSSEDISWIVSQVDEFELLIL